MSLTKKDTPIGSKASGKEFAKAFSRFVNVMCNDEASAEAVEILVTDHRTLQQNTMRFFMEFVKAMAGRPYDHRNEASVKLAQQIMEIEDRFLPFS